MRIVLVSPSFPLGRIRGVGEGSRLSFLCENGRLSGHCGVLIRRLIVTSTRDWMDHFSARRKDQGSFLSSAIEVLGDEWAAQATVILKGLANSAANSCVGSVGFADTLSPGPAGRHKRPVLIPSILRAMHEHRQDAWLRIYRAARSYPSIYELLARANYDHSAKHSEPSVRNETATRLSTLQHIAAGAVSGNWVRMG